MSCTTADISFTMTLRDLGLIPGVLCGPEPYTIPPSNSNLFDSLPPSVTVSQSLQTFSKRLKTELFQRSYTTASLLFLLALNVFYIYGCASQSSQQYYHHSRILINGIKCTADMSECVTDVCIKVCMVHPAIPPPLR